MRRTVAGSSDMGGPSNNTASKLAWGNNTASKLAWGNYAANKAGLAGGAGR